jgi:predicted dehydrogenase
MGAPIMDGREAAEATSLDEPQPSPSKWKTETAHQLDDARQQHERAGTRSVTAERPSVSSSAGAGVILDITVHDADALRFVTRREVVAVTTVATSQEFGAGGIEDTAMCVMQLDDGALAMTHESFAVPHAHPAFELHGSAGSVYMPGVVAQDPAGELLLRKEGRNT